MAIFYCHHHQRPEDTDAVGYVEANGHAYCTDSAPEAGYDPEEPSATPTEPAPREDTPDAP